VLIGGDTSSATRGRAALGGELAVRAWRSAASRSCAIVCTVDDYWVVGFRRRGRGTTVAAARAAFRSLAPSPEQLAPKLRVSAEARRVDRRVGNPATPALAPGIPVTRHRALLSEPSP